MSKLCRVALAALLVTASLCATGCLHTWAETYHDYPPDALAPPHSRPQGNPSDG
jgi:hypothetical protein